MLKLWQLAEPWCCLDVAISARTRHYYQSLDAVLVIVSLAAPATKGSKSEEMEEKDMETIAQRGREQEKAKNRDKTKL